jgi:flagellar L-ring protein FlgH
MMHQSQKLRKLIFCAIIAISITGCSSIGKKLKAFLGGKPAGDQARAPSSVKYTDNPNVFAGARRQYKRTTKQSLQDDSALEPQTGSLWVMEGQGAYLFAENVVRMIGDPIAVTLEGEPKEQLQAKADVIKKLWAKFEERVRQRQLASQEPEKKKDAKGAKDKKDADGKDTKPDTPAVAEEKSDFGVKSVPTRIVERTVDGNYRVKGTQPFLVGSREYKVIVTGVVRAEDFNEEGISSTKLLDAKYDIVSVRRKEQDL